MYVSYPYYLTFITFTYFITFNFYLTFYTFKDLSDIFKIYIRNINYIYLNNKIINLDKYNLLAIFV